MDLYIFDFDDTLALTDSKVRIVRDGKDILMSSRDFAYFQVKSTDEIDFSDFSRAQGTLIKDTADIMLQKMKQGEDVYIVTARAVAKPVEDWLTNEIGQCPPVVATSGSEGKIPWLEDQLQQKPYGKVVVYEDCRKNIRNLKQVVEDFNSKNGSSIVYNAMCILPDQSITQLESRWRSENLITEGDFRQITRDFIRKLY